MYKKWKPLYYIALSIYCFIPVFEKPSWCVGNPDINLNTTEGKWYCNDRRGTLVNSNIPKLPPQLTEVIEIICLVTMLMFLLGRDKYRRMENKLLKYLQVGLSLLSLFDLFITVLVVSFPWPAETIKSSFWVRFFIFPYINALARPILLTLSIRNLRTYWKRYLLVIKGTAPLYLFIITFVFYYAWMGNRLFSGTIEGIQNFKDMQDSFYYMFVLLTTANYPDVMLPSYNQYRMYSIFFISFLAIGLFLFMNLLLAVLYSTYQEKTDDSILRNQEMRNNFFLQMFRFYDNHNRGGLDRSRVYEFLKEIDGLY